MCSEINLMLTEERLTSSNLLKLEWIFTRFLIYTVYLLDLKMELIVCINFFYTDLSIYSLSELKLIISPFEQSADGGAVSWWS